MVRSSPWPRGVTFSQGSCLDPPELQLLPPRKPCAWPWDLPSQGRKRVYLLARPRPVPIPREVPGAQGWGCPGAPGCPAPGREGTGPGCWALPGWISWGALTPPAPQPQGAAGPRGALTTGLMFHKPVDVGSCFHCRISPCAMV